MNQNIPDSTNRGDRSNVAPKIEPDQSRHDSADKKAKENDTDQKSESQKGASRDSSSAHRENMSDAI